MVDVLIHSICFAIVFRYLGQRRGFHNGEEDNSRIRPTMVVDYWGKAVKENSLD